MGLGVQEVDGRVESTEVDGGAVVGVAPIEIEIGGGKTVGAADHKDAFVYGKALHLVANREEELGRLGGKLTKDRRG